LLQVCCTLKGVKALYVTGEESLQQIAMRAKRLGMVNSNLVLAADTQVENICATALKEKPAVLVIDSIQTMQLAEISSTPGGVTQVRESAARLTTFAKQTGTAIFLVGHVTKSGELAGPRVLEHIIDVVCYIEGSSDSRYRVFRAVKNRYGAVNELGVFAMTDKGMKEVKNKNARGIFITATDTGAGKTVALHVLGTLLKDKGVDVGVMKPVQCAGNGLRLHDHPLASAIGPIIRRLVTIFREVAEVGQPDIQQPPADSTAQDSFFQQR